MKTINNFLNQKRISTEAENPNMITQTFFPLGTFNNVYRFNLVLDNVVNYNGIILKVSIENNNLTNYLQLDGNQYNLIKTLRIYYDDQPIEELDSYNEIFNFKDIFIPDYSNKELCKGTKNKLIPPKMYGNNSVFNPTNRYISYLDCEKISNGKIDFGYSNKVDFEFPLRCDFFRNLSNKDIGNGDFRMYSKGLDVRIEFNDMAFFAPIFNSRIEDMINAFVDGNIN
jgi:hypothetical protein